eukprot:g4797.t1
MSRISWFPGHMRKAMRLIEEKLKLADAVIEVRDARIPISSINPTFNDLVEKYKRPKLIVINKADLIDVQDRAWVKQHICKTEITNDVIFTSAKKSKKKIVKNIKNTLVKNTTFSSKKKFKHSGTMVMVVGMPNVGKSSIINLMRTSMNEHFYNDHYNIEKNKQTRQPKRKRRSHVAKTGAKPGLTRHVAPIQITTDPNIFLFDTPGVMIPRIELDEIGFKLALANVLPEKLVSKELLAEHLLNIMNNKIDKASDDHNNAFQYIKTLKLPNNQPIYDINELLHVVGNNIGRKNATGSDLDAATFILNKFHKGQFGKLLLDERQGM